MSTGRPGIVVSNAGKSIRRSLHDQYERPHDFDRTIGINYLGPIWLLLGLLPAMRERGVGAHSECVERRCPCAARPAVGRLPGVQGRIRYVAA